MREIRFGLLLVIATLLFSMPSMAASNIKKLQVTVSGEACDAADAKGRPTYKITAKWNSGSATPMRFYAYSGNGCTAGDKPCGSSGNCSVTCAGACSIEYHSCGYGRAAWVQIGTPDGSVLSDRVPSAGPPIKQCQ